MPSSTSMLRDTRLRRVLLFVAGVAVIAAIAFAFFYPDASMGRQLRQHDMQQGIAIGQEAKAYTEATGEVSRWTNSLFSGMPTFQISPSYPSSRLFSWITAVMGLGLPAPSNLIAMMMVGFFILMTAMRMRWPVALLGAVAYGFSTYFVIIIGAGHIWKFVTLAYVPPTIAGIILAYRGKWLAGSALAALFAMMQIASNHIQMSYYFAYVVAGVAIAYLCAAVRAGDTRRWLKATGALAVAAVLAVGANLPSLYNTYEYSKETMRGRHSELSATADPLAPQSADAPSGLDKDYITQYSYQPSETFSLVIPNIKGGASARPVKGQMTAMSLADTPDVQQKMRTGEIGQAEAQYLGFLSQYFGDPEGTNGPVYVGALIFAFFLLGCVIVKGPLKWALLVLTLFSIVLAWGRHAMAFTDIMLSIAPMYSKFRTVESILVIAEFTIPLLAAMALQQIFTTPRAELVSRYGRATCWTFGITAAICLLAVVSPGMFGTPVSELDRMYDSQIAQMLSAQGYDNGQIAAFSLNNPAIYRAIEDTRFGMVKADALRSLLIVAIGFAILAAFAFRRAGMALSGALICVLTLIDLYTVNKRYLSSDSFAPRELTVGPPIAMTPADEAILQDTAMNYRVMDIPRFYSADPSYYHKMVGGYHAAKLTRYQDLIDRHLSAFTQGTQTDADWNVLNMLNAKYVVTPDGAAHLNPEAYGNAWFVDRIDYVDTPDKEMAALSQIDPRHAAVADAKFRDLLGTAAPGDSTDTVVETSYAPNRLTYSYTASTPRLMVLSEVYFPWGWHAEVDGTPVGIGRVDYLLRAVPVPAGHHTLTLTFDPESLHTTDAVATASVVVIYLLVLASAIVAVIPRKRDGRHTSTPTDSPEA